VRGKIITPIGNKLEAVVVYINERRLEKEMFVEQPGDAEQAELFALGLIKEPKEERRLILVPCKHPKMCRTHGTYVARFRFFVKRIKRVLTPKK
jgi:hypothetical protein